MRLQDFLSAKAICLELVSTSKEQVLSELAGMLVGLYGVSDRAALIDTLVEREGLGSTGIGHGVAIPHGRCNELTSPALVLGRTKEAIDFDSIDGEPTRIFFLMVAPDNGANDHLHLLAKIARLVKNPTTREQLLAMDSPEAVAKLIAESEGE